MQFINCNLLDYNEEFNLKRLGMNMIQNFIK